MDETRDALLDLLILSITQKGDFREVRTIGEDMYFIIVEKYVPASTELAHWLEILEREKEVKRT